MYVQTSKQKYVKCSTWNFLCAFGNCIQYKSWRTLTVYQKQKISKDLEKKYFFKEILSYIIIQLLTFSSLSVNGNKTFVIMT